jgi:hypothetical protein
MGGVASTGFAPPVPTYLTDEMWLRVYFWIVTKNGPLQEYALTLDTHIGFREDYAPQELSIEQRACSISVAESSKGTEM